MDKFFILAGALISHHIEESGHAPMRQFKSVFTHENGVATYDGDKWAFKLNT